MNVSSAESWNETAALSNGSTPTEPLPSGDSYELADELAASAQHGFSAARSKGLSFLFDHEGQLPRIRGSAQRVRTIADHMLRSACRSTTAGGVFFRADVRRLDATTCLLQLRVADTDAGVDEPLPVGDLSERGASLNDSGVNSPSLALAANLCRSAGGRFWTQRLPGQGSITLAELRLACEPGGLDPCEADALGAQVWLVGQPEPVHDKAVRRLTRLGWSVRTFTHAVQALHHLEAVGIEHAPALLCGLEPGRVGLRGIQALRKVLPRAAQVLWLVDVEAPPARLPGGDIQVQPMPLSKRLLLELTDQARRSPLRPSGLTQPAPLIENGCSHVLVVDDNQVNRILASEMLRALGYEAEVACDGMEAVSRCLAKCPAAVLMDLSMPRMDGLAATRRLRQLQREGALPPFPILAATAHTSDPDRLACAEAGMDDLVPKPIDLQLLGAQLARALADRTNGSRHPAAA